MMARLNHLRKHGAMHRTQEIAFDISTHDSVVFFGGNWGVGPQLYGGFTAVLSMTIDGKCYF
jgi:hypothetical protein